MNRWQASKTYFWEEAPFFRLLLPFLIAIIFYDYRLLPSIPEKQLLVFTASSITVYLISFIEVGHTIRAVLIHISVFLLSWTICKNNNITSDPLWYGNKNGHADAFAAKVLETPAEKERTYKTKVAVLKAITGGRTTATKGEALLYIYKDSLPPDVHQGDVILLPNNWTEIKNPGNPFEFDYARFCRRNNLYCQQFLSRSDVRVVKRMPLMSSALVQSHHWGMNILAKYIKDSSTLGLMQAMLLGDDINFDDDLRQSYSDTGVIHIVAISGSHVTTFFFLINALFFWIRNRKYAWAKFLLAIPFIWYYVMVAGMPSSAVRAAVMFSLLGIGMAFNKSSNPLNQLFAAAFLMLLVQPNWLFSIGFQLSFVAVLSLILFYKPILGLLSPSGAILQRLWQGLSLSLAAEILVAPLVIYYFHLLPAAFLIANLVAYVLMGFALTLGVLLVALSKIAILAKALALLLTALVLVFNHIILLLQKANPPTLKQLYLSLPLLVLVYLFIAAVATWLRKKNTKALITSLGAASLFLVIVCIDKYKSLHQEKLIVYNISKLNYAEHITGETYQPITPLPDNISAKKLVYGTKEAHITWGAVDTYASFSKELITVCGKKILILHQPLQANTPPVVKVEYLFLNYPVKEFNAPQLVNAFHPEKLIIGSNQKRYIAQAWKDSCNRYNIPAHFTLLDGAFVLTND